MVKKLMSAYVDEALNEKRRIKGLSWESVIKRGLEDIDNSLEMNRRFDLLIDAKINPMIKELRKRIFDLEQENEKYIERLSEVRKWKYFTMNKK